MYNQITVFIYFGLIIKRGWMGIKKFWIASKILIFTLMLTCYGCQQVFSFSGFFFPPSFSPPPLHSAVSPIENSSLAQASCKDCA